MHTNSTLVEESLKYDSCTLIEGIRESNLTTGGLTSEKSLASHFIHKLSFAVKLLE